MKFTAKEKWNEFRKKKMIPAKGVVRAYIDYKSGPLDFTSDKVEYHVSEGVANIFGYTGDVVEPTAFVVLSAEVAANGNVELGGNNWLLIGGKGAFYDVHSGSIRELQASNLGAQAAASKFKGMDGDPKFEMKILELNVKLQSLSPAN